MIDLKELQEKSVTDLQKLLAELRDKLRTLRFKVSGNQHKDVRDIREVKKNIAQILTLLKHKQATTKVETK